MATLAGALVATRVHAQQPRRVHVVGWLSSEPEPDQFLEGFREGMRRYGYVEGQNLAIVSRFGTGDPGSLAGKVEDVTQAKPALIVARGTAVRALRAEREIPILFALSGDPISAGLASSFARPGRNFTGTMFMSLDVAAKRVDLLKQAVPKLRNLVVFSNLDHPGEPEERQATLAAATTLGLTVTPVLWTGARELDGALAAVRDARGDAMIVFPEGVTIVNREKIVQFATGQRLPTMFGWSEYCDAGGLMSYGANQREAYVNLATYADRVLRGSKPGDLPIDRPTRFELVLNLKTARALGLMLPQSLLLAAARVIE
ncbi:MAG: ABC transporter substrate-binding protein [Candidatus Rokubacteria bacterium]|nr:ABC transporter substrate-binding protein [Candidatus Rokubacteria bacterium]